MVFKKIDYLQWISAIVVFIFFMFLFQFFLPLSMVEKVDGDSLKERRVMILVEISRIYQKKSVVWILVKMLSLSPPKFLIKFQREKGVVINVTFDGSTTIVRFGNRKPQLALLACESNPVLNSLLNQFHCGFSFD
ncbi:hypothetical protein L6452_09541 [Arctium lappa]|uniref:Uncharacterized protein n=1 Tax=Arctium lappa TaxID=4217 RepID=A0ACB9DKX0_ARCLA|nr:hypothetical protein L6452_09541 [Arctium lappa]